MTEEMDIPKGLDWFGRLRYEESILAEKARIIRDKYPTGESFDDEESEPTQVEIERIIELNDRFDKWR